MYWHIIIEVNWEVTKFFYFYLKILFLICLNKEQLILGIKYHFIVSEIFFESKMHFDQRRILKFH
jgi:hypothetical protein